MIRTRGNFSIRIAALAALWVLLMCSSKSFAQSGQLNGGSIQLNGSTSGSVTIAVPSSLSSSFTLPLPKANPASALFLFDSSGVLKWGTPPGNAPTGGINFDVTGTSATEQQMSNNSNYLFNVSYAPTATGPLMGAVLVSEIADVDNHPSVASDEVYAKNTNTAASGVTVTAMNIVVADSGSGTQVGIEAEGWGLSNNYAMLLNGGNVGIGTSTPAQKLEVNGNIRISGGSGLSITEGTNGEKGQVTLASGTATVATTAVTANSRIFLTPLNTSSAPGVIYVSSRTPGTNFIIKSTNSSDVSKVSWMIVEPGP